MTSRPAVIDTNVVVSGLITKDARAPTARIVDGMLRGRFPFLLSNLTLREYREVLLRPAIRRKHGLDSESRGGTRLAYLRSQTVTSPVS